MRKCGGLVENNNKIKHGPRVADDLNEWVGGGAKSNNHDKNTCCQVVLSIVANSLDRSIINSPLTKSREEYLRPSS